MELHITNPDLEAKVDQWVSETGRPAGELIEDAMASYFGEIGQLRQKLDQRYRQIKHGHVQLVDGDEAFSQLMERTEQQRKASA